MISPHAVWWRAIERALPGASAVSFMGHSGALADLAVCAPGCDCRLRHALSRSIPIGLAALGLRAVSLAPAPLAPARISRRIAAAVSRGRLIAWIAPDAEGIVTAGPDPARQYAIEVFHGARDNEAAGAWKEQRVPLETLLAGDLVLIRHDRSPRHRPGRRGLSTLLEWTASSYRPTSMGGCVTGGALQPHGEGLPAYALWADAAAREQPPAPASRTALWCEARQQAAEFVRAMSGKSRDRGGRLLRIAADLYEEEASLWKRAAAGPLAIHHAERIAGEAAQCVAEAALLRSGLPAVAAASLLEPWDERLDGIALNEILYLARAGVRPLRELAANRLSGAPRSQAAAATLAQLLYDEDGRVASTALWALSRKPGDRLGRQLLNAARHGPRDRAALDYPFSRTLLAMALSLKAASIDDLVALSDETRLQDAGSPLLDDIDAVLSAGTSRAQGKAGGARGERAEQ